MRGGVVFLVRLEQDEKVKSHIHIQMAKRKKEDYISEAPKKVRKYNSDDLRTLMLDDDFQNMVLKLRAALPISPNGIKTDLDMQKAATPEGRAEFDAIKEKFDLLNKEPAIREINTFLNKYNLSLSCSNVIIHYILFNDHKFFQSDYFQVPDKHYYVRPVFFYTTEGSMLAMK